MNKPLSLFWYARHELRLSWRDTLSMMTAGHRERETKLIVGVLIFTGIMHLVALAVLRLVGSGIRPDLPTLVSVTGAILLSGSAMLSQAMESVTRNFYSRSDLELILSAPVKPAKLFAVRIGAVALSGAMMSVFLMGPFIDVLAWRSGARWLGAYGVLVAVSLTVTALAVVLTATLFQTIGPKRTRLASQIVAAIIGGAFVIGLQVAALFSTGTYSRLGFLRSSSVIAHAPGLHSPVWWAARAALGDGASLAAVGGVSLALFLVVTAIFAPRFADYALLASSASHGPAARTSHTARPFRAASQGAVLRRKERVLILRDPWLMSQSLMQLLYLVPPALLLLKSFGGGGSASIILVPVLIMAAGQLAGGLAWLTISGEDAPDLIGSAPLNASALLRAKIGAVMQGIAVVFLPFAAALAFLSPAKALIAIVGIVFAALSAIAIQLWFRSQSQRSHFRRRHTSSRIATFAEAFVSISWAGAGAVAASGNPLAVVLILFALGVLLGARFFSPARALRRALR